MLPPKRETETLLACSSQDYLESIISDVTWSWECHLTRLCALMSQKIVPESTAVGVKGMYARASRVAWSSSGQAVIMTMFVMNCRTETRVNRVHPAISSVMCPVPFPGDQAVCCSGRLLAKQMRWLWGQELHTASASACPQLLYPRQPQGASSALQSPLTLQCSVNLAHENQLTNREYPKNSWSMPSSGVMSGPDKQDMAWPQQLEVC